MSKLDMPYKKLPLLMAMFAPAGVMAAADPDFPSDTTLKELNSNYYQSTQHPLTAGINLFTNPNFNLCSDYTNCGDNSASTFDWTGGVGSGSGFADNFNPADLNRAFLARSQDSGDKNPTLKNAIALDAVNTLYFKFMGNINNGGSAAGVDKEVYLVLDVDGNAIEFKLDTVVVSEHTLSQWYEFSYVVDLSTLAGVSLPYSGDFNLVIKHAAGGVDKQDKFKVDDFLLFTDKDFTPSSDADGDGVDNSIDAFPNDPSASVDTDGDGYPDQYNDDSNNCDQACQDGSALELDVFPNNKDAYADLDGDGDPDAFISSECQDENGDSLASCNGLTLDLDMDGDGESNELESTNGTRIDDKYSYSLDIDGDGWANEVDGYPNNRELHHATNFDFVNITSQRFSTADSAVLVEKGTALTDSTQWEKFYNSKNGDNTDGVEIIEATKHDGSTGKLFKLAVNDAGVDAGKNIQLRSLVLTPPAGKITHAKFSAWIKLSGNDDTFTGGTVNLRTLANLSDGNKSYAGITVDAADNADHGAYYNSGAWHYVESTVDYQATVVDAQIHFKVPTDHTFELLVDDFQLNWFDSADSDADGIADATDVDDDNDNELDGVDATPLGNDAVDSDFDGILDGYDDDRDGDSVHNVFDDNFTPNISAITEVAGDSASQLMVTGFDQDDAQLTYAWSVDNNAVAGSDAALNLLYDDYTRGSSVTVAVTATDGKETSTEKTLVVAIPVQQSTGDNSLPVIEDATAVVDGAARTVTLSPNVTDADTEQTLTYLWTIGEQEVGSQASLVLNEADYTPGQNVLATLKVSDGVDDISKSFNIVINQLPELAITSTATEGGTQLDVAVTDLEDDSHVISWVVDGLEQSIDQNSTSFVFTDADYQLMLDKDVNVTITVTDVNRPEYLVTQTETITIKATVENAAPVISGDPLIDQSAQTIMFEPTVTDAENAPLTYEWTINGEVAGDGTSLMIDETDYVPGTKINVALVVSDGLKTTQADWSVETNNKPTLGLDVESSQYLTYINANVGDKESNDVTVTWQVEGIAVEVPDGSTSFVVEHDAYVTDQEQEVTVTVTVSDPTREGHSVSSTKSFTIKPNLLQDEPEDSLFGGSTPWQILLFMLTLGAIRRRR